MAHTSQVSSLRLIVNVYHSKCPTSRRIISNHLYRYQYSDQHPDQHQHTHTPYRNLNCHTNCDTDCHCKTHQNTKPAVPPGVLFAMIKNISVNVQDRYVVDYETFEFVEKIPCNYFVHFYFDTVSQDNTGDPGRGPWIAYGGPRPFIGYAISNRPAAANLVALFHT